MWPNNGQVNTMKAGAHMSDLPSPTTAEHLLQALEEMQVDFFFGNGGTDFPSIVEAFAKRQQRHQASPRPMTVAHENLAMSMAHGCYLASGRMQAVMVHVGVGTANALCGVMNAARDQVPILLMAGRTPLTEFGSTASRNVYIHWAQDSFDQGGMVREYVKWDHELRAAPQIGAVLGRARAIAQSVPPGPVYLTLPRERLAEQVPGRIAVGGMPVQSLADGPMLDALVKLLPTSERPLLITSAAGRTAEGFDALTRFAEAAQIPVVQYRPRAISLPPSSPVHAGYDPHPVLGEADLVLVADADVPWIPSIARPNAGATTAFLGADPLCGNYPYWGFDPDVSVQGGIAGILDAMTSRLAAEAGRPDRREWLSAARRPAAEPAGFNFAGASRILGEELADAVFVNENPLDPSQLGIEEPGRYFASSPAGGLGWGLGAALGVRLARPDRLVVCAVGDGAYMFGNPVPFHYTARRYGLPVLTVVFDNKKWGGVERATRALHPDLQFGSATDRPFIDLDSPPDYGMICTSCGGAAFEAHDEDELRRALRQACAAVKSGRQALIDLHIG